MSADKQTEDSNVSDDATCSERENLGQPKTIGELKYILSNIEDSTPLQARNAPLHNIWLSNGVNGKVIEFISIIEKTTPLGVHGRDFI